MLLIPPSCLPCLTPSAACMQPCTCKKHLPKHGGSGGAAAAAGGAAARGPQKTCLRSQPVLKYQHRFPLHPGARPAMPGACAARAGVPQLPWCSPSSAARPVLPQAHAPTRSSSRSSNAPRSRRRAGAAAARGRRPTAGSSATAGATAAAKADVGTDEWTEDEELGLAARATLSMLEWSRLCRQVRRLRGGGSECSAAWTSPHSPALRPASHDHCYPPTQISSFAQTTMGQRATAALVPPSAPALSARAVEETRAVDALEAEFAADLDFGGIQTAQVGQ